MGEGGRISGERTCMQEAPVVCLEELALVQEAGIPCAGIYPA